jgi:multiple antibiotic resistance protein
MKDATDFFVWVGVALVALLPVINPVSTAVLLLSISAHLSQEERNRQITRACLYMIALLVGFLLAGHLIMVAFGISIPGIRIAGGMVIGFLGFRMLFPDEGPITGEGKHEAQQKRDISFSPLAMPSLSGPGAIAVVITMSSAIDGRHGVDKVFAYTGVVLAIVITAAISWLILRGATGSRRILGVNGVDSFSRIMGFFLVCIGIQFAINGVRDLVLDTAFWQN